MKQYNATIEIIADQRAAIIALFDADGWVCAGRIELSTSHEVEANLYEYGYIIASKAAASKGGHVETYRRVGA